MKTINKKGIALATLGVMTASTIGAGLGTMQTAQASAKGKKKLAIGLGAVTAYGLLKHNKTVAIAGALGTAYTYSKYKKAKKQEDRDNARRAQWYKQRYGSAWRSHYRANG